MRRLNGTTLTPELVGHLVELRIILEKTKPLEQKLKYQIDKLVKASILHQDGAKLQEDILQFKPNPSALVSVQVPAESTETDVYKPPKLAPMPYNPTPKLSSKLKESATKSRMMRDLRDQFDDRPEEMDAEGTGYSAKTLGTAQDEKWQEREDFEEANFVRLNLSKADKKLKKQIDTKGHLMRFQNEWTALSSDFNDISQLNELVESEDKTTHGSGVLAKRSRSTADIEALGKSKKTKYASAGELISNASRGLRSSGKDSFSKSKKHAK